MISEVVLCYKADGHECRRTRWTFVEVTNAAAQTVAYVYAGGELLARHTLYGVMWAHRDPNLKSHRSTDSGGTVYGDGTFGLDWDKVETDADGNSVGLSAPVSFPTESNDLFTSGWSFGTFSTGQSYVYLVDGIHVPPEFVRDRIDNGAGDLALNLLFFSAAVSAQRRVTIFDPTGTRSLGTFDDPGLVPESLKPTIQNELKYGFVDSNWSLINLISVQTRQTPSGGGGGEANGQPKLNTGPKATPPSEATTRRCLKAIGATNFTFKYDPNTHTKIAEGLLYGKQIRIVTHFTRKDSKKLGQDKAGLGKYNGGSESGLTLYVNPLNNDIASDVASDPSFPGIALDALYSHEVGNALVYQKYKSDLERGIPDSKLKNANSSSPTDQGDKDPGVDFERCLYKRKIVGLRSGRLGNSREF